MWRCMAWRHAVRPGAWLGPGALRRTGQPPGRAQDCQPWPAELRAGLRPALKPGSPAGGAAAGFTMKKARLQRAGLFALRPEKSQGLLPVGKGHAAWGARRVCAMGAGAAAGAAGAAAAGGAAGLFVGAGLFWAAALFSGGAGGAAGPLGGAGGGA